MQGQRIRIEADFQTEGIWQDGPDEWDEIDRDDLPISATLRRALGEWRDRWDAIFNDADPPASYFETAEDERRFVLDGYRLQKRLQAELGPTWDVHYSPISPEGR